MEDAMLKGDPYIALFELFFLSPKMFVFKSNSCSLYNALNPLIKPMLDNPDYKAWVAIVFKEYSSIVQTGTDPMLNGSPEFCGHGEIGVLLLPEMNYLTGCIFPGPIRNFPAGTHREIGARPKISGRQGP